MRLGIVGTGTIVKESLPFIKDWGWTPVALCGTVRSKDKVEELAKEYNIPQSYTDYSAMLEKIDVDAIYIAVPNFLHYSFAKQALEAGYNVIVEKPITSNNREAEELSAIAKQKNLYLFEAITTVYLPNYNKIKQWLPLIGTVKIVSCNYSQYSRRYDAFMSGTVLPVFDPMKSGGALMDLNLYNLHYLIGLFGSPKTFMYYANIEKDIDTSGILVMNYDTFKTVSIAAKDCNAPNGCIIEGTKGYIQQNTPAGVCAEVTLHLNDGKEEVFNENPTNRMESEFITFSKEIASGNRENCYKILDNSLLVSKIQTKARLDAGIYFPADK